MAKQSVGQNVTVDIKSNKVIIEIDLSKEVGPSKSQKTIVIGKTGRNVQLENGMFLGCTLYRYPEEKE